MIGERIKANFSPGLAVKRGNLIQRQEIALRFLAAIQVQHEYGLAIAPWRQILRFECRSLQLESEVGSQLHGLGSEQTCGLVMAMATVHAAPAIDDDVRAEAPNDADHVFKNLVAPDFLGFLGSLRIAKIFGP